MNFSHRFLLITLISLISACGFSQKNDTTIVLLSDSINGIKKIIHLSYKGANYNVSGFNTSKITKRDITKYDKTGKIIYKSYNVTEMEGCVRHTKEWDVISYDQSGSYKTLKQKKKNGFVIKTFDKNGKLISKEDQKYAYANWLDPEENRYYP